MGLRSYNKQHVTIEGPDGVYLGKELDNISRSINSIVPLDPATLITTVAGLPAAASYKNWRYMVTDATATAFWGVVAGGGANTVPVVSDGTNWRIG